MKGYYNVLCLSQVYKLTRLSSVVNLARKPYLNMKVKATKEPEERLLISLNTILGKVFGQPSQQMEFLI
ncbi:hypothetical protein HanRHA438_Chr03g0128691 [Helianthus annuus]|nr:hypothetical protein HanRHA438_Chr03g0128691 [Helianthus annuus]